MVEIKDIHPLTDFLRNNPEYRARLKASSSPIVLTVKGRPELVMQNAEAYDRMLEELKQLKLERLREEIQIGIDAYEAGNYKSYTTATLKDLFADLEKEPID